MVLGIKIQYDGRNYFGWQRQTNAVTIQEKLEDAVSETLGYKVSIIGAGRTDSGVSARGQTASIKLSAPINIHIDNISRAINSRLPDDIFVTEAKLFEFDFHARFDALFREYSYTIILNRDVLKRHFSYWVKYNINLDILYDCAKFFHQDTDFTTFSKLNPDNNNPVCNIVMSRWEFIDDNTYIYRIKANHFLYGMVRSLVGTMIDAARGKRNIDEIHESLIAKDRNRNSPLAPPNGLCLEKIYYPDEFNF